MDEVCRFDLGIEGVNRAVLLGEWRERLRDPMAEIDAISPPLAPSLVAAPGIGNEIPWIVNYINGSGNRVPS